MSERIYLDYAATTPVRIEVIEKITEVMGSYWGNPSSQHGSGREAKRSLEASRTQIANLLGVNGRGITFTSGATEANNLIIRSNALRLREATGKNHIITGIAEHPSVYDLFKELEEEGFEASYIGLDETGVYDIQELREAIREETILASLMAVNNETGAVMPIREIADLLHENEIFFHSDFAQTVGKVDLTITDSGADAVSITAHKIYGPKGVGLAYQNPDIPLRGLLSGGHQESDRRAGTESVALIAGFAKALEIVQNELAENTAHYAELSEYLYKQLDVNEIKYDTNITAETFNGIHNIWFEGLDSSQALIRLDLQGIAVSAGSACAAGSLEPSRILASIFADESRLKQSLRISFGIFTEKEDIDKLVAAIGTF